MAVRRLDLPVGHKAATPPPRLPKQPARCPMCGYTVELTRELAPPWVQIQTGPVLCPWDGTILEKVER